ncbi:neuronal acetylcholine receptor subunit alpha-10-like [Diadema antillarum]|uniref:neuronal acetylcholine receptor subunit alpha-10-like n=1 Tax=Diadema antillarum TaxID=105358 RepID=UPI003A8BB299
MATSLFGLQTALLGISWIILSLLLVCQGKGSANMNPSKRLYENLRSAYGSVAVRPIVNMSQQINVYHRLLISQIIDFDEPLQRLTLSAWQRLDWKDDFLTWNPANYSGVTTVEFEPDKIWKPDIHLYENVDKDFMRISKTLILADYEGNVTWYAPIIATTSCRVNVMYFPFDVQMCELSFSSWVYTRKELDLHLLQHADANQNVFIGNGVWNLSSVRREERSVTYDCCPAEYTTVRYTLVLTRTYAFYLLNMIIPSILLCFTNTLVYLIPPESGEKVQFAVSNLLASILFQQLIAGLMPPLGEELPLLGIFFLFMVMCSCLAIACSILSLRFYNVSGFKPVPASLRKFILLTHARAHRKLLHRVSTVRSSRHAQSSHQDNCANASSSRQVELELKSNGSEVTAMGMKVDDRNNVVDGNDSSSLDRRQSLEFSRDVIIEEWRLLARVIDKLLFVTVLVVTCTVLIALIVKFASGRAV